MNYIGIVSQLEDSHKILETKVKNLESELRHSRDVYFRHLSSCKSNGAAQSRMPDNIATLCTEMGPTIMVEMSSRIWDTLKTYNSHLKKLVDPDMSKPVGTASTPKESSPSSPQVDKHRARMLEKSPSSPMLKRKPSKQFANVASKVNSNFSPPSKIPVHIAPVSEIRSRSSVRSTIPVQDRLDKTVLLNIIHQQGVLLEQSLYSRQGVEPEVEKEEKVDYAKSLSAWKVFDCQRTEIAREWAKIAVERFEIDEKGGKLETDVLEFWNFKVFELFDRLGRIVEQSKYGMCLKVTNLRSR
jgi:hypothetical protein